ncbi:transcriptional repressor LexA [Nitrospina watsonii]|uniref:LexA repressor n=1 Tax=Nitrospina watsonii TaxID=1323948 RepID=A0ABN8VTD2_9BACT|nr:transcriptional repressor LexA [Nitrospina watsonii]CAI2716958.1 LexA repressor [Nitrospina watsonii]
MYLTRRQKEIHQFIESHIRQRGYAPSIMEIAKQFQLSSPATVHKHLSHLEAKGLIRRQQNQSRAIELVEDLQSALEYPLLGTIAAGRPLEVFEAREMMSLLPNPGGKDLFVLRVQGQSMIDDHIQDGDYVIVERRDQADNGETVVALLDNDSATLKRFYREKGHVRLQPANAAMPPIIVKDGDFQIQGVVVGVLRKF